MAFGNWRFNIASHPLNLSLPATVILFLTTISATILMTMPRSCSADDKVVRGFPAEVEALMLSMSSFAVGDRHNYSEDNHSMKVVEAWAHASPAIISDHHGMFREVFNVMDEGAVGNGRVDDAKVII